MCIQDMFSPLLQRCSQLIAAGENTDKGVTAILSDADAFVVQLADIYDFVTPCFPPDYHIFGVVCAEYHRQLGSMVDFIGLCAENLANSDILKVMQWIHLYQESLAGLGVEEEDVKLAGQAEDDGTLQLVFCLPSTESSWQGSRESGLDVSVPLQMGRPTACPCWWASTLSAPPPRSAAG